VPLLLTVPGISWLLAYTIAAEIGDIGRFSKPRNLASYSDLCPRVNPVRRTRPARPALKLPQQPLRLTRTGCCTPRAAAGAADAAGARRDHPRRDAVLGEQEEDAAFGS
jgi:transposase